MIDEIPPQVWKLQASQAPGAGTPNRIEHGRIENFEALFFYDEVGLLRGLLKYFDRDIHESEGSGDGLVAHAGEIFVIVDPDYRRRGIGTRLLREATCTWNIDLTNQGFTPQGVALVEKFRSNQITNMSLDKIEVP